MEDTQAMTKYNKLAVWSFIVSIFGSALGLLGMYFVQSTFLIYGGSLISIAAIFMAAFSFGQMKRNKEKGKALAILAILGVMLWPMIFGFVIGIIGSALLRK